MINFFIQKMKQIHKFQQGNKSINSLLESTNELSNIFKDLQTVVQERGTILDRIDYNLEIAEENTKNASGHLMKRIIYKKKVVSEMSH